MHKFPPKVTYHTRLDGQDSVKVAGGSFGGEFDMDTANRLTKVWFTVTVKPSGRAVFVDREGREVNLYVRVEPADTEIGKPIVTAYKAEQAKIRRAEEAEEERKQAQIDNLLGGLSHDEILRRLQA